MDTEDTENRPEDTEENLLLCALRFDLCALCVEKIRCVFP
jgi:hypothetical protein